ncbi:hypothetical protein OUY22_14050 [Nonomuraea sp. MCN248]|uniref:Transcriptional regulator n=1 Tax=Nonomuraea corallina TaxID=2989783 RepID=A0ABT4SBH1_9ACTN|nr:hypothetical protein [Nonomuraea corallina]MDA0634543.1 hypothetical protein [Nonomuraea corallina]
MVCDPPEKPAGQISATIGASRASLTMNLRLLTGLGFLTWRTRPGDRTMYYRMADDASVPAALDVYDAQCHPRTQATTRNAHQAGLQVINASHPARSVPCGTGHARPCQECLTHS